jgi:hypothetical protein
VTPPFARVGPAGPRGFPGGPLLPSGYPRSVVFQFESMLAEIVFFVLLGVKVFAFIDALTRPTEAYVAAGKLTKPAWLLILGLVVATALLWPSILGLFSIIGIVAAFVYLLDVRPALVSVTRRR